MAPPPNFLPPTFTPPEKTEVFRPNIEGILGGSLTLILSFVAMCMLILYNKLVIFKGGVPKYLK